MDAFLSQTQDQRMTQVLAPQLRQSLEVLQVPMLELRTLIAKELQANPTLEEIPPEHDTVDVEPERDGSLDDVSDREFEEEFELLAQLDDDMRTSMMNGNVLSKPNSDDDAKHRFLMESITEALSLQEHLIEQLAMSDLADEGHPPANLIIGSIDEDGYLATSLTELAEVTRHDEDYLEYILCVIQDFDPVGVGSRTLQECLLKQIERLGMLHLPIATIIEHHLNELAAHKYQDIARRLHLKPEGVQDIAHVIATLEPKPGRKFHEQNTPYVMPDVYVQKDGDKWVVQTNDDPLPQLRISQHYRQLMADKASGKDVRSYIRDKVRAGSFLMKSIGQRQETVRRIANEIVKVQEGFLDEGVSALKPLTMSEVADKLEIHETTVSRAIANKYMQTPQGLKEMKYFFTPGFKNASGEAVSTTSVKDAIQKLVLDENPAKPLSDSAMVKALAEQGLKVARRTIAKYRDKLKILPSHLRKQI